MSIPWWLSVALAFVAYLALIWAMARLFFARRERVRCPVRGQTADVLFVLLPDGSRGDVLRCSLLTPARNITCSKGCLPSS